LPFAAALSSYKTASYRTATKASGIIPRMLITR
jgi:hypothetical protein